MDIKTENRKWKAAGRFPSEILFLTGFLTGTILPNMIWKMEWKQKTLASFYLIRNFAEKDISGGAYFGEILRRRGGFFLLLILCGFTVFGVPLSVVYMLILGLETGMVLAMSVLEFGLYGGLGRSSASSAPVSDLCSCLFLAGKTCVIGSLLESGKIMACSPQKIFLT